MNPTAFRLLVATSSLSIVLGLVLVLDRVRVRPRHQLSNNTLTTGTHTNPAGETVTDTPGDTIDKAPANTTLPYVSTYSRPSTTTLSAQDVKSTLIETEDPLAASTTFLGFLEITEQLSSNTLKLLHLSYFSVLWNLTMIEPWIDTHSAHLYSLPPVKRDTVLFFDIYNQTALEMRLTKCFEPGLPKQSQKKFVYRSLNDALIHSSRDVLIVIFKRNKWRETMGNGECDSISGKIKNNVQNILNHHVQNVKDEAQKIYGREFMFKVWRTVCITAIPGVPFSMKKATIFIQQQLEAKQRETNKNAIVVLPTWETVKSEKPYGYFYDPNFRLNTTDCQFRALPLGSKVMTAVDRMMETYGLSELFFISMYTRTERLTMRKPQAVKQCLDEFPKLLESIVKRYIIPRTRVFLVHDAGKYGSSTFNNDLRRKSQKVLSFFQSFNITTVQYDPNLNKDLLQDRMFVAAVEQEFLSRGHVLLTLGDGGYVINVMQRFISRQSADRVYSLCGE